jgi:hypothetical protein
VNRDHNNLLQNLKERILKVFTLKRDKCQAWWHTLVILAVGRIKAGGCENEASLGFIGRPWLKNKIEK